MSQFSLAITFSCTKLSFRAERFCQNLCGYCICLTSGIGFDRVDLSWCHSEAYNFTSTKDFLKRFFVSEIMRKLKMQKTQF